VQPTPVTKQEDEQISYPPKEGVRTLANACIPELSLVKSELCVFYFTAFLSRRNRVVHSSLSLTGYTNREINMEINMMNTNLWPAWFTLRAAYLAIFVIFGFRY